MTRTDYTPTFEVQIDTATFPSSSPVTVEALGCDIDLGVDADNGSATVLFESLPASATEGRRLYIYGNGTLIFNGQIAVGGTSWNPDGTVTLSCVDALHKLRNAWGGADRTYNDDVPADTDTSTAQNIVEASGIDASLTSIQGAGQGIGVVQDVVIHGGTIVVGTPTQADVMLDVLRLLDRSIIPNFATFTRGDGVVYRRSRVIGSSVATFSESTTAWGFERRRVPGSTINKAVVTGLTIAGVPTEATASASNSFLTSPFQYNTEPFQSYFIEGTTWAQSLADWIVAQKNGRLNVVNWTTALNNTASLLGSTVTVTSSLRGLSSQLVYVTAIRHHIDARTAITTFTAEFRD